MDELITTLSRLPVINPNIQVKSKTGKQTSLLAGEDYVVEVEFIRRNSTKDGYAYAPLYSKQIEESWFIVLGQVRSESLKSYHAAGYSRIECYYIAAIP
jgi:hypothetical protein